MKKIFFSLVMSLMFLFVVWTIVAYINYGDNMINYRLDLESTFRYFNFSHSFRGKNLFDYLKEFASGMSKMLNYSVVGSIVKNVNGNTANYPVAFRLVLTLLNGLLDPIFTLLYSVYVFLYALVIVTEVVLYVTTFVNAIISFVFEPIFVENITNPWACAFTFITSFIG